MEVAAFVKELLTDLELFCGMEVYWMCDSVLESLWVRIRTDDLECYSVMVGICYRALIRVRKCRNNFEQLEEVHELLMLVHMRDLNFLVCAASAK